MGTWRNVTFSIVKHNDKALCDKMSSFFWESSLKCRSIQVGTFFRNCLAAFAHFSR